MAFVEHKTSITSSMATSLFTSSMEVTQMVTHKLSNLTYQMSQNISVLGQELNSTPKMEAHRLKTTGLPDFESTNYARYADNDRRLKIKIVMYLIGVWCAWPQTCYFLVYMTTIKVRGIAVMSPRYVLVGTTLAKFVQTILHLLIKRWCYTGFVWRKAICLLLVTCAVGLSVACTFVIQDPNLLGILSMCQMVCSSNVLLLIVNAAPFEDISRNRASWNILGTYFPHPIISAQVMLMENVDISFTFMVFAFVMVAFMSIRESDL